MTDLRVTAYSLHVRRTPQLGDNVVGYLHKDDVVQPLQHAASGPWTKVRHGGLQGWASDKWMKPTATAGKTFEVTATALHVRREPRVARGNTVGYLTLGDRVTATGTSPDGKWRKVKMGALTGWASARYLRSVGSGQPAPGSPSAGAVPWMEIAEGELAAGIARTAGSGDNPLVTRYLKSTSLGKPENRNDETPWCSAFVNWCVEKSGNDGTNSAMARSWLGWGHRITTPVRGCVVVFWRERKSGSKGHVGFFVGKSGSSRVRVLGGNQGDRVSEETFPLNGSSFGLLEYRML